ncbi:MAG: N-6 DNA methylase [Chloracidobacterium sp.]|nr:N-6 DNA methylase [Chloracidobacterium sp.]
MLDILDELLSEVTSNKHLISLAVELGAMKVPVVSEAEKQLTVGPLPKISKSTRQRFRSVIENGADPLGIFFSLLNSPEERRSNGAVYTPIPIVDAMIRWSVVQSKPERIIDAGVGSGRFLTAAGKAFRNASLVGFECDPLAALLARANIAVLGLSKRSIVHLNDYRNAVLNDIKGQTLYIGNPPWVRHHLIEPKWKTWLTTTAHELGHAASALAGLHVYFFLATAKLMRRGDVGILITASEWLDVNYGSLVRGLFLEQLGGTDILVIEPEANPFERTAATAVITGFRSGKRPSSIGVRRIDNLKKLGSLTPDRKVSRERFEDASRWTPLTRSVRTHRSDFVELGEICRVHRGQVTGANAIWIENEASEKLPSSVLFPAVTRARELFRAGKALTNPAALRRVIDIPPDLKLFEEDDRKRIKDYLRFAKLKGADEGYVATHRRAWWSVGLKDPAPILATYMARRPPAFVRNLINARHINIAHGLYPIQDFGESILDRLAQFLSHGVSRTQGRTYAGGLTKFEPREMERLPVPSLDLLRQNVALEELLD